MQRVTVLLALVVLAGFSGCVDSDNAAHEDVGSRIAIDHGDGNQQHHIDIAPSKGAIVGHVEDDRGFRLSDTHISVLGTDHSSRTDSQGVFHFLDLDPSTYRLRIDHSGFRPAEEEVQVEADRATHIRVTLVPLVQVGAAYRDHVHDLWRGETTVRAIDQAFDWHEPHGQSGPFATTARLNNMVSQTTSHHCVFANQQGVWTTNRMVWFDEPHTLVYAGTERIDVSLNWNANDWPLEGLAFAWRHAGGSLYNVTPLLAPNEIITIDVTQEMWDSSHQQFTLWEFWVCTDDQTPGQDTRSFPFLGSVHVIMDLHRMEGPIPPEPGHPRFWESGTERLVVTEATKRIGGSTPPGGTLQLSRNTINSPFIIYPDSGVIVPPGTGELRARLEWTVDLPLPGEPWSLSYRPANVFRFDVQGPADLVIAEKTNGGPGHAEYIIPLQRIQTDAYYQKTSNWMFFLNQEGQEEEDTWLNPCGICTHTVTLTVTAHQRDDFTES